MSFATILENIRMVAIKRSPIPQQKQAQAAQTQASSPKQAPQCPASLNDSIKVCDGGGRGGGGGVAVGDDVLKLNNDSQQIKNIANHQQTTNTKSNFTNHHPQQTNDDVPEKTTTGNSSNSTPVKHYHKRQSISARGSIGSADLSRNSPGRERNRPSNVIVEIDSSGATAAASGSASGGSKNASGGSRGSRELSPTPKNQQRKMSTDFRGRAGSFIHVDEEGRSILMRKPVRLKNIEGRPEVYDTLHFKGREVSCQKNSILLYPLLRNKQITFK